MPLAVQVIAAGPIQTNAYLVVDETTNKALIVDAPPDSADALISAARDAGATIEMIVLTHHHWDHIVDAAKLAKATGAPVAAHPEAVSLLEHPRNPSFPLPEPIAALTPQQLLSDGDTVKLGESTFVIIHTPGHAPDQISLYDARAGVLLSGDTLFSRGYGRTDLPGSSEADTVVTMARLLNLPDAVTVYPGHGPATTIGAERGWMTAWVGSSSRQSE